MSAHLAYRTYIAKIHVGSFPPGTKIEALHDTAMDPAIWLETTNMSLPEVAREVEKFMGQPPMLASFGGG